MMRSQWPLPPRQTNEKQEPRRIGVEIELAGLDAISAANIVQERFGGALNVLSQHRTEVLDSALGDFLVELDFKYAHGDDPNSTWHTLLGDAGATILPMEIVCPPLEIGLVERLEELLYGLKEAGASGTRSSIFYALAVQINIEADSTHVDDILNVVRAYILLRDWLREEIQVDTTRELLGFAKPFPDSWCNMVLGEDYQPNAAELIDDYLKHNPTRNRELDLLPLLAHLDEARVRRLLPNETINPRPAYHYRLPNMDLENSSWSLSTEWERWLKVEKLANQPELIRHYAQNWRRDYADGEIAERALKAQRVQSLL